jgi:cobalt-zinc-cadmium efflux system outer membrane protein
MYGRGGITRPRACSCLLALSTLVIAAPARALVVDLAQALALARARNPTLHIAAADVVAAQGRHRQAELWPTNPVLWVEGAAHSVGSALFVDRGISLDQELEIGAQRRIRIAAADHDVSRTKSLLDDRQRTVDGEVRRAFFGLAAADRRNALADDAATLANGLLDTARRRRASGDVAGIDVDLAIVEAARREQARAVAQTERVRAATRLGAALGIEDVAQLAVTDVDADVPIPARPLADLVERALAARPDVLGAAAERRRLESAADLVHREGEIPNVTVRGFVRQEVGDERIAGAELSVPLPLWNRQQGTESALRANAVGAEAETDRLRQEIVRQVHLADVRLTTAETAWARYQRDALPAVRQALARLEDGYRHGYLALPEVLVQQDRLVDARAAAIAAWLEVHEARADLIEVVGDGEDTP